MMAQKATTTKKASKRDGDILAAGESRLQDHELADEDGKGRRAGDGKAAGDERERGERR